MLHYGFNRDILGHNVGQVSAHAHNLIKTDYFR